MNSKSKIISREECEAIIKAVQEGSPENNLKPNKRVALLLTIMAEEGTKLKTVLAMTPASLCFQSGSCTGNVDGEEINLSPNTYGMLMSFSTQIKLKPHEKFFPFTERNVQSILKKGATAAGIPDEGITPQSFRKYFAYNKVQAEGIDATANALKTTRYRVKEFIKN